MAAKSQEKIVFGVALLVLLSAGIWAFLEQPKLTVLRKTSVVSANQVAYVPSGVDVSPISTSTWPTAPAQTRGPLWIYHVFTPPEIYYNEETKEFTVTPPIDTPPPLPPLLAPFGIELVAIKQDVFRLQLVGYVGDVGTYMGTFENAVTGEAFLAKAGKKLPALNLTIRDFDVKRTLVPAKDSMPIYENVATAVVIDGKTGEAITLTNKERRINGTPFAIFKATGSEQLFEQKADSSFSVGDNHYVVDSVMTEPASAEVTKQAPDMKSPETKTLTLLPSPAPSPASSSKPTQEPDKSAKGATPFPPMEAPTNN